MGWARWCGSKGGRSPAQPNCLSSAMQMQLRTESTRSNVARTCGSHPAKCSSRSPSGRQVCGWCRFERPPAGRASPQRPPDGGSSRRIRRSILVTRRIRQRLVGRSGIWLRRLILRCDPPRLGIAIGRRVARINHARILPDHSEFVAVDPVQGYFGVIDEELDRIRRREIGRRPDDFAECSRLHHCPIVGVRRQVAGCRDPMPRAGPLHEFGSAAGTAWFGNHHAMLSGRRGGGSLETRRLRSSSSVL